MKRLAPILLLVACGGPTAAPTEVSKAPITDAPADPAPDAVPVDTAPPATDSWADWKSFTNVSPGPWISNTHGKRFVEIYVNDIALEAYKKADGVLPVGSIVVKPSWENENGSPGADGPLFIMEKMPAGFAPESEDWFYGFQWADPPEKWKAKLGGNVDWRSPSEKVEYCADCHDGIARGLGMPPKERTKDW